MRERERDQFDQFVHFIVYAMVLIAIFGPYVYWLGGELLNYLAK